MLQSQEIVENHEQISNFKMSVQFTKGCKMFPQIFTSLWAGLK